MQKIDQQDLRLINDTFSVNVPVPTIKKDALGRIIQPKKVIVNTKGYEIKSFLGRTLKHDKWVIPKGGQRYLICRKGQKYEDIPEDLRGRIKESDFEEVK